MPVTKPAPDLLETKALAALHGCVVFDRANGGRTQHALYRRVGRRLVPIGTCSSQSALWRLVARACNLTKGAQQ